MSIYLRLLRQNFVIWTTFWGLGAHITIIFKIQKKAELMPLSSHKVQI